MTTIYRENIDHTVEDDLNGRNNNWDILEDVNNKKHTHNNKSILDAITQVLINNWNTAVTHISDSVKHITSTERANWDAKETPAGAQAKADEAAGAVQSALNSHMSAAAPHSGHETPAGAQAKANTAETNAKNYTDTHAGVKDTHSVGVGYYIAKTSRSDQLSTWAEIQGKPSSFTPSAHKTTHAIGGSDALSPGDIGAETPAGAQAKANTAEANAKAYTDAHEQKAAPHSGHETPAGAQAKAEAAAGAVRAELDAHLSDYATHKADNVPHQYGNRFAWEYNSITDSLDLVVIE